MFGEQIINKGAMGLAVPWQHFHGLLRYNTGDGNSTAIESNQSLEKIAQYIIHHPKLAPLYDTNLFLDDIEKGIYFDSNIPQGYGLGSSGALVAAIYEAYRKNKKKNYIVSEVKQELGEIESFFHGKSSGLDPIVCFLNKAVLITGGQVSDAFDLPKSDKKYVQIFLINTHIPRQTSTWVKLFLKKCEDKKFMQVVDKSLIPANNIAIESFLQQKHAQLLKSVKIISQLQYDLMPEFIPEKFKAAWLQGLKSNEYHLKVCGAGGGGFIIGFAKANADISVLLSGFDVLPVMSF